MENQEHTDRIILVWRKIIILGLLQTQLMRCSSGKGRKCFIEVGVTVWHSRGGVALLMR